MIYQGDVSRCDDDRIQTEILPMYGSGMKDSFPATVFKADTGLTLPFSRKRLRDSSSFNPSFCLPISDPNQQQFGAFEFLTEDISSQIYQQQLETDRFVALHLEKVRTEIRVMRRQSTVRLTASIEGIMNRLKMKEEEILKIRQLNRSLEEKVKSISIENRIWRELAQTNEATANVLQNNLQQVITKIQLQQHRDAESQRGSNFEEDQVAGNEDDRGERNYKSKSRYDSRCWNCWKEESCVLLLPCRHLCVCSVCVSSINICPLCNYKKSVGLHVNMI